MLTSRISSPAFRGLVEWLIAIGMAVLLFFVLRTFVFRVAHVSGTSMLPTLENGDMVILNRFTVVFGTPRRGDIVAFQYPENPSEHHIKRIIGIPGDVVDFNDGRFFINGAYLVDDFSDEIIWSMVDTVFPLTVQDGYFFVFCDNRNGSRDSRHADVGTIPVDEMVGRAVIRIWPFATWGRVG